MDIRVFQAAATVIPTLLIAAVFTTKIFEKKPDYQKDSERIFFILTIFSAAIIGESACISILANADKSPNENLAAVAIGALFIELILLSGLGVAGVTATISNKAKLWSWVALLPSIIVLFVIWWTIR